LLINGLSVRKVGSASGSQHGKRCTRYDRNFQQCTSPSGK
jgi:hypothetical protein